MAVAKVAELEQKHTNENEDYHSDIMCDTFPLNKTLEIGCRLLRIFCKSSNPITGHARFYKLVNKTLDETDGTCQMTWKSVSGYYPARWWENEAKPYPSNWVVFFDRELYPGDKEVQTVIC